MKTFWSCVLVVLTVVLMTLVIGWLDEHARTREFVEVGK